MASIQPEHSTKPLSDKQRAKLEKFARKKEKQAQQAQKDSVSKEKKKHTRQDKIAVDSKDWVEETPSGQRKVLRPLDDDSLKAYNPNVIESAWYDFWEKEELFKPKTDQDGKGKYVLTIPPPNVCTQLLPQKGSLLISISGDWQAPHRSRSSAFFGRCSCQVASNATIHNALRTWL